MRRTTIALAFLLAPAAAGPAAAQWPGPGPWARPCFGPCRPWVGWGWARPARFAFVRRPFWPGPAFGPARFGPGGFWGRPAPWVRALRWRRWAAAAERRPPPAPRYDWTWRIRPAAPTGAAPEASVAQAAWPVSTLRAHARPAPVRAGADPAPHLRPAPRADESAVAVIPAVPLRPEAHRSVAPRLLESAVLAHRPTREAAPAGQADVAPARPALVARPRPLPVAVRPVPPPPRAAPVRATTPQPAALRSEPAAPDARTPPVRDVAPPEPAPQGGAAPTLDVPVAPLD